jgi:hypothetical protein
MMIMHIGDCINGDPLLQYGHQFVCQNVVQLVTCLGELPMSSSCYNEGIVTRTNIWSVVLNL